MEVVLDSGADGSVLPLEYGHIGQPDPSFDGSSFVDAQGKPICIKDARIAEVRFGSVIFKERFIIAAVTSPLISMGRLLKEGWYLERNSDGMFLARNSKRIPVHFRRNSLCAMGVIRMVTSSDTSISSDSSPPDVHVRALTLSSTLSGLAPGWNRIGVDSYALRSILLSMLTQHFVLMILCFGCVPH